jgi:small subunit ribosomal protein S18
MYTKRNLRKKVCRFCEIKATEIDYKDVKLLRNFITERGRIISSRVSGTCAHHHRMLDVAVKRARNIALLPFPTS